MKTFIIDVREPDEYAQGHVNGSVNIPLGQLPNKVSDIKSQTDTDTQVILYCRSGGRAGRAKTFLQQQGIANVINGVNQATIESTLA